MSETSSSRPELYQEILVNAAVAEIANPEGGEVLAERFGAHRAAMAELQKTVAEGDNQSDYPEKYIEFVIKYLYQTGSPVSNSDVDRQLDVYLEWEKQANESRGDDKAWLPETDEEKSAISGLIIVGSALGIRDKEPAFGPALTSQGGRSHEVRDRPDSLYNKYGFLLY